MGFERFACFFQVSPVDFLTVKEVLRRALAPQDGFPKSLPQIPRSIRVAVPLLHGVSFRLRGRSVGAA
jgi:hypothetical protein